MDRISREGLPKLKTTQQSRTTVCNKDLELIYFIKSLSLYFFGEFAEHLENLKTIFLSALIA